VRNCRSHWNRSYNALTYVLAGQGSVGLDRSPIAEGQMAVHVDGDFLVLSANESQDSRTQALEVLVLGGEPIREPVATYGPFVMTPAPNCSRPSRTTRPVDSVRSRPSTSSSTSSGARGTCPSSD